MKESQIIHRWYNFHFLLLGRRRASFSRLTPHPRWEAQAGGSPRRGAPRARTHLTARRLPRPTPGAGGFLSALGKASPGRAVHPPRLLQTSSPDLPTLGGEILQPVSVWPPGQTLGREHHAGGAKGRLVPMPYRRLPKSGLL